MLSLLEHMYHELGLVHEFNTNPIILKRWLVSICNGSDWQEHEKPPVISLPYRP